MKLADFSATTPRGETALAMGVDPALVRRAIDLALKALREQR